MAKYPCAQENHYEIYVAMENSETNKNTHYTKYVLLLAKPMEDTHTSIL